MYFNKNDNLLLIYINFQASYSNAFLFDFENVVVLRTFLITGFEIRILRTFLQRFGAAFFD